jgi:hypothetical protein
MGTTGLIVTDVVLTVEQSTFSLHLMVISLFTVMPVDPFAGVVSDTEGAVLSTVTVFPADGVSTLPAESVARL